MTTDDYAKQILEYMRLDMDLKPSSAILGLGSSETRVADRAAQLILDGYSDLLIFSGGYGKIAKDMSDEAISELVDNLDVLAVETLRLAREKQMKEDAMAFANLVYDIYKSKEHYD